MFFTVKCLMELVGKVTATYQTQKLRLCCFGECFLTCRPQVTADGIWTAQSKRRFHQSKCLCIQPKLHFIAQNPEGILYWHEEPEPVEVIKDPCWTECLELTMAEAYVRFVSERISLFPSELSYMQWGSMEAQDLGESWRQNYLTVLTHLDDIIPINNKFLYQLGLKSAVILCKLCSRFSTDTDFKDLDQWRVE